MLQTIINGKVCEDCKLLKITARYGGGGHESEYVVQLWTANRKYDGMAYYNDCIPFPWIFSSILQKIIESQPKSWHVMDRGSRIEIMFMDKVRTDLSHPGFSSNHPECERLLKEALAQCEKELKQYPSSVSDWTKKHNRPFEINELKVGEYKDCF